MSIRAPESVSGDSARAAEELWQTVFDNPHIGVAIVGPDRRFLETNERFRELVGYTEEEISALTVLDITHPEDRPAHVKAAELLRTGKARDVHIDKRYVRKDGRVVWVRVTAMLRSADPYSAVALVEDVTERRKAELDALGKERHLRLVVDQMDAIVWTTDRELRFTTSFGSGLKGLGLRSEDVVGRSVLDFPESPDAVEVSAHRRALAGESCTYPASYAGRLFQAHVEPLKDETGDVVGVIGVCFDISDQRRAEEMLRESEARYRLLFEGNPSPMWVIDAETFQFLAVNDAALRHYGYSREEFLAMKATDIRTPEEAIRWKEYIRTRPEIYQGGGWRHLKKDGTEIHVEVVSRAITFAGVPAHVALVRDVTDRRRAQERLARSEREMRALSARLQTVREEEDARVAREVHDEIGQALTGLGLDVAWLANNLNRKGARARFGEKLRSMAELIETTTGSVERIASDLRPGILDEVGLGAAAEWAVRQFQDRTGIDCRFESTLNGDAFDLERATAIFRILREALTNVARHARARHVKVRLRAEAGRLLLDVSDDGAGIDPAKIADSRSFGLLGMRERARALDGNCVIAPRPEGGTRVSATIPLTAGP
jgi:PAS domain S-box-containing protein